MTYHVQTVTGEIVEIVEKVMEDGSRPLESLVFVAVDGRKFTTEPSGIRVREITEDEAEAIEAAAPAETPAEAEAAAEDAEDELDY